MTPLYPNFLEFLEYIVPQFKLRGRAVLLSHQTYVQSCDSGNAVPILPLRL